MKNLTALTSGVLFSMGLVVSGMTDPRKILNFLDVFGRWDASLIFVMGAGLAITTPAFYFILRQKKPVLENEFCVPTNNTIDKKLLIGSALFGIGWGMYGYCPGPAITSLTYMNTDAFLYVASMFVGMFAANRMTVFLKA